MFTNNESDKGHVTAIYYLIQNIKRRFLMLIQGSLLCGLIIFKKSEKKASYFHIQGFIYHKLPFNVLLIHKLYFVSKIRNSNFQIFQN